MEWNGNFGMEYGRCQNGMEWKISRMEWKTIFHTSIPIPYYISCIVFTEKYTPMSGSDKILSQKYSTSISAHIISRQIAVLWLCTLRKQCTYCIIVSTLQFNCSIDVTVDDLDRLDLLFFFVFFLRLTICPVVNFVFFTSRKLVFAISSPFQLNFIYIFSF